MNPGPVEEAGKLAGGIVDALKAQPAVLALSLAQIAMLVFMFYALAKAAEFRDIMIRQQFEYAHKISDLLAKCVVPDRTDAGSSSEQASASPSPPVPPASPSPAYGP